MHCTIVEPSHSHQAQSLSGVRLIPSTRQHAYSSPNLSTTESIKSLIRIANKRQTHLGIRILRLLRRLCPQRRGIVRLRDFVDREVLRVDVGLEFGLERRVDAAQAVPLDAREEGMRFDLVGAAHATESVFCVADEARDELVGQVSSEWGKLTGGRSLRH